MQAKLRRAGRLFVLLSAVCVALVIAYGAFIKWEFPYGWSHCCDKQLMFALHQYAEDHNGAYPAGESSPEASLSLLYPKYADAYLLRGKTVPWEKAQSLLEAGQKLGPDSCSWHYVEGLRLDDDGRLALFWDKLGLGHNGQRNPDGGAWVYFINFDSHYVSGSEWPAFLADQERLKAAALKKRQKLSQKARGDGGAVRNEGAAP
ncbi:MAG TPA: hypothetical protein VFA18_13160 [Gemmataceae bacterium]|nr:hypothetical protein [Gemmataceae bacterium]